MLIKIEGIQAQTLSVFHHALEADLKLLAVINKVDLPHASPAETSQQISSSLGLTDDPHMHISAKSGLGVDNVLRQIVEGLPYPPPWAENDGKLRGLVFDHVFVRFSYYIQSEKLTVSVMITLGGSSPLSGYFLALYQKATRSGFCKVTESTKYWKSVSRIQKRSLSILSERVRSGTCRQDESGTVD